MNDLFQENIAYLKINHPIIYSNVLEYMEQTTSEGCFQLISDEVLNIKCELEQDTYYLHSKYNPQYESERWLEAYNINKNTRSDFILYGLGLTYHLAPIIENYPHVKLFIYEPEIGVFIEALKVVNIEQLLACKNIRNLSVGKSNNTLRIYANLLYHYAKFPISLLDIPVYRSIDSQFFLNFLKVVEQVSINKLFRNGFHLQFGDQMFRNSLRNLVKMVKTPSLDLLKDRFKGCTAIIVGGGPSLQYDSEYLKKIKEQCLIIAAGSSVQSLVYLGVEPHLIVSMDPGISNANVFTRNNFNDLPLLYMPQIHHEIIEVHSQYNVFGYYSNDPILRELIDLEDKDYTFTPSYSVTGTAIQAAIYLGATTVFFTGQDLSYPGKQIYSPGAVHSIEVKNNQKADASLTEEVDNVNGGKNPTTFSMRKTLENIEDIIKEFPEVQFINASSQGAVIQGADFQRLQSAFEQYKGKVYSFNEIKTVIANTKIDFHADFEQIPEKVKSIVSALKDFRKICNTVLQKLERLQHLSHVNFHKAEKMLREIEGVWEQVIKHRVFKEVVEEWMPLEINEYDQKVLDVFNERDIVKKADLLDKSLGQFCKAMIKKLKDMQEDFEYVLTNLE